MAAEALNLALVAERLQAAAPRPAERRRFRRIAMTLSGRIMDQAGREHPCRTADISPGDARVASPTPLNAGERVVIYLDQIGRLSGHIARACSSDDYAVIFDFSPHKREKLAEVLTFMAAREKLGLEEERASRRLPSNEMVTVHIDGRAPFEAQALDVSLTGMSIRSDRPAPPIGVWVQVGMTHGRVARRFEGGFAIDFQSPPPR